MESIESNEKVSIPTATQGERPKHTSEGHELCAYYMQYLGDHEDRDEMLCPHGESASGAFYSEDLLFELKQVSHQLIADIEGSMLLTGAFGRRMQRYLVQLRELTR